MRKVVLNIFKVGDEYRAVIQVGNHAEPVSLGTIIYQDGMEIDNASGAQGGRDKNEAIRQLKDRAKNWAREQGIPFVHNLDFNPYD